ncbi:hypothetical protein S83_032990, partial [Arachis hypogaea]
FIMMRKNGFVQYLVSLRKKKQFKINTSFLFKEWVVLFSTLREERWLHHMQQALDSTSDIDDESKIKLINFS